MSSWLQSGGLSSKISLLLVRLFNVVEFLANQQILLLFLLVGVGMLVGHVKIKGVSLGAAAVLFVSIAVSALAAAKDTQLLISSEIGHLGLAIFAFAIGTISGPSFFRNLKTSLAPIAAMVVLFVVVAGVGYGLGVAAFGMDIATVAGVFAGATTNTPALSAAGESSGDMGAATVGYSIAYIFGVVGMMAAVLLALRVGRGDPDAPSVVTHVTIRVDREDRPRESTIHNLIDGDVRISRLRRGEQGPIWIPVPEDRFEKGDLVNVAGTRESIERAVELLGHVSSHSLRRDRHFLDFRRITVSDPKVAGHSVAQLNEDLWAKYGALITRVRRGDIDQVAFPETFVEMGDRVRVVADTNRMKEITRYLGDSSRGLTDLNPVILGLGLAVGIAIGEVLGIGAAAGTLIVGLVLGKIGRVGPVTTTLPHSSAQVLSEAGLLMFLAQAGTNAGGQIASAFTGGTWLQIIALGAVMTSLLAVGLFVIMRMMGMGGTKLSGVIGGAQTQPALLAFANNRTETDPRVALGYALVYPVAMVAKILIAQLLGSL